MNRKNKDKKISRAGGSAQSSGPLDGLSGRGKKVVSAGAAAVVLGYIALSQADPMGRNAASLCASFLLVGGYAAVAIGIFLPEPPPSSVPSEKTS